MAHDVRKPPASFQTFGPAGPNHSPGLVPDPGDTAGGLVILANDGTWKSYSGAGSPFFANPTGTVGLTAVNGSAGTAMRSDAAPPLSQAIVPTWTGLHTFGQGLLSNNLVDVLGTIRSRAQTVPASGQGLELLYTGGQGFIQVFDRTTPQYLPLNINANGVTVGVSGSNIQGLTISGGANNQTTFKLTNGSFSGYMCTGGSQEALFIVGGASNNGSGWIATATGAGYVQAAANGVNMATATGVTIGATPTFVNRLNINSGTGFVGIGNTSPGFTLSVSSAQFTSPIQTVVQITNGTYSGYLTNPGGQDGLFISGGSYLNSSSQWIATATTASLMAVNASGMEFYTNSGLTVGGSYTNTRRMSLNSSTGFFGINTATPQAFLHVNGLMINGPITTTPPIGASVLFYGIQDGNAWVAVMDSYGTVNSAYSSIYLRAAGGSKASPTALPGAGIAMGAIYFEGYMGSGFSGVAGGIECATFDAFTPSQWGSQFYFYLTPSGSTSSTNLIAYLQGNGLFNIGNATYSGQLKLTNGSSGNEGIYTDTQNVLLPNLGGYNVIYDPSGNGDVFLSATQNLYRSAAHAFQPTSGSTSWMTIASGGTSVTNYLTVSFAGGGSSWIASFQNTTGSAGNLGCYIACGAPAASADTTTQFLAFYDSTASGRCGFVARNGASAVIYSTTSDSRMKTTTRELSDRGLIELKKIPIRDFRWTADEEGNVYQGIYAQELQPIYPEAVSVVDAINSRGERDGDLHWGIDYGRLIPLAVRAVQQLSDSVDVLVARVDALSDKVDSIIENLPPGMRPPETATV